ncbi:MAG: lytic transglycosylase [Alphaproteobacteria bacterium]|nr:MAG: lytic transglycosylase [Alphaproteobacteria bacterium]
MGRRLRLATGALLLALAGCGTPDRLPPAMLDDACAIAAARPDWVRAMRDVERRWGVRMSAQMAIIHQESKFRADARTPHRFALGVLPMGRQSSALGYAQAIDSTWDWYRRDTGRRSARRTSFADSVDFMGWYMNVTHERLGIDVNDVRRQYLAYHQGHVGYRRGSWRRKGWLRRIAADVARRERRYAAQLKLCPAAAGAARGSRVALGLLAKPAPAASGGVVVATPAPETPRPKPRPRR